MRVSVEHWFLDCHYQLVETLQDVMVVFIRYPSHCTICYSVVLLVVNAALLSFISDV